MTRLLVLVSLLAACGGARPAPAPAPEAAPAKATRCPSGPVGLPPEPRHELDQLEDALREYARRHGGFPVATVDTAVGKSACGIARVEESAWDASPWKELGFRPRPGHQYYYAYDSDGQVATFVASMDLDCDGTWLVYTSVGDTDYGKPTFTHSRPNPED